MQLFKKMKLLEVNRKAIKILEMEKVHKKIHHFYKNPGHKISKSYDLYVI